jgi:hypothetical protein
MIPRWINKKDGSVLLNDLIRYVKGGVLVPDANRTPLIIPAAPSLTIPSSAPSVVVEAPPDAVCEIFSLTGEQDATVSADAAARMTVNITDVAYRRSLMSRHVPAQHVFGGGGVNGSGGVPGYLPMFLRESLLLEQQQTLLFDFNNNSIVGPTSFRFMLEDRKFQATVLSRPQVTDYISAERRRKLLLQPYWLTTTAPVNINPGATIDIFFNNLRNSYFVWFDTIATFVINEAAGLGGDTVQGFTANMFDAKTERPLNNQPVPSTCMSGSSGLPFQNPTGLILEPDTLMHWQLTSLIQAASGGSIDVFITLVGVLSYDLPTPLDTRSAQLQFAIPSPASVGAP